MDKVNGYFCECVPGNFFLRLHKENYMNEIFFHIQVTVDYNVRPRSMSVAAVTIHVKMGADVKHYPLDTSVTADQDSLVIYPILSKQMFTYKIFTYFSYRKKL